MCVVDRAVEEDVVPRLDRLTAWAGAILVRYPPHVIAPDVGVSRPNLEDPTEGLSAQLIEAAVWTDAWWEYIGLLELVGGSVVVCVPRVLPTVA